VVELTNDHGQIAEAELLKLQKSGQFACKNKRRTNSLCKHPDVLSDNRQKGDSVRGAITVTVTMTSILPVFKELFWLFIINGESERYKEDQYMIVGVMKD
jgi:hypothetical protein